MTYWEEQMAHEPTKDYYEILKWFSKEMEVGLRVLEFGTGWGISGSAFLDAGAVELVSIDINLNTPYGDKARTEIEKRTGDAKVELVCDKIENHAKKLIEQKRKFDIVYIDGDHGYEGCLRDLWLAHELVQQDGAIILDDFLHVKNLEAAEEKHKYGIIKAVREYSIKTHKIGMVLPTRVNAFYAISPEKVQPLA